MPRRNTSGRRHCVSSLTSKRIALERNPNGTAAVVGSNKFLASETMQEPILLNEGKVVH